MSVYEERHGGAAKYGGSDANRTESPKVAPEAIVAVLLE
jgi:hypothetical protein